MTIADAVLHRCTAALMDDDREQQAETSGKFFSQRHAG
jgi:hypothetical protein